MRQVLVDQEQPGRRQDPRVPWEDDGRQAETLRDAVGVQRPGPPVRHQGVVAKVDVELGRVDPGRLGHVVGHDAVDGGGGLDRLESHPPGDPLADRRPGGIRVEPHRSAQERVRTNETQHHVGVRDRRLAAPTSVADGARLRSRAPRPDAQEPDLVDLGDAASARPDLQQVDHRHADR